MAELVLWPKRPVPHAVHCSSCLESLPIVRKSLDLPFILRRTTSLLVHIVYLPCRAVLPFRRNIFMYIYNLPEMTPESRGYV